MNKTKNRNRKTVLGLLVVLGLTSCTPSLPLVKQDPKLKIISLSVDSREVVIMANESLDLSNYVLRQGETKSLYSLSGIHLQKDVAQKVTLPTTFLKKKNNSLSLSKLEIISVLEEI